jgi:hypothetical protein
MSSWISKSRIPTSSQSTESSLRLLSLLTAADTSLEAAVPRSWKAPECRIELSSLSSHRWIKPRLVGVTGVPRGTRTEAGFSDDTRLRHAGVVDTFPERHGSACNYRSRRCGLTLRCTRSATAGFASCCPRVSSNDGRQYVASYAFGEGGRRGCWLIAASGLRGLPPTDPRACVASLRVRRT